MSTSTTEQVQITTEHVGRVWVERYTYDTSIDIRTGRMSKHRPQEVVTRFLINSVEVADASYYRTCPDAGPRVKVGLRRFRPDGSCPAARSGFTYRWFPTTGNLNTVEIEVAS